MKTNLFELKISKQLRYGGYATLVSLVLIVVLILVNLVVDQVPLRLDLTRNKLYTLSEQTYQVVGNLTQPVTIYGVYQEGRETPEVWDILQRYRAATKFIQLDTIDPVREPALARRFDESGTGVRGGSLVVAAPDRFRVISQFDLVTVNQQTNQATSLNVEQQVTSALLYVTSEQNPKLYSLQGHGERSVFSLGITRILETENFDFADLSLVQTGTVPEDASIVAVVGPERDISTDEEEALREYLDGGGRALLMLDWRPNVPMPNFDALLRSYGIGLDRSYIIEGDPERHAPNNPLWLLPDLRSHEITSPLILDRMPWLTPIASPVVTLETRRRSIDIQPLLVTSDRSWARGSFDDLSVTLTTPAAGEVRRSSAVAVSVTDRPVGENDAETKLIVVGTSTFLDPSVARQVPGNINFLMNSLNWLYDRSEPISVRPKSLMQFRLRMTGLSAIIFSGVVVILIPFGVLAAGLVVWLRRRHR